jgi:hypothetical protein
MERPEMVTVIVAYGRRGRALPAMRRDGAVLTTYKRILHGMSQSS